MQALHIDGGFTAAPQQSAAAFRSIMNAIARPGEIETLSGAVPPPPVSIAAGTVILTLCDPETPLYLCPSCDSPAVRSWIAFHTGAPITAASDARFVLGHWAEIPITDLALGTSEYPDRSASCIVDNFDFDGPKMVLSGPGIKTTHEFAVPDADVFQRNAALFPLGLDFLFTADDRIAGLPRSTKVQSCM